MNERDLQIFAIATFVSADANRTNDERKRNIALLEKMRDKVDDDLKIRCDECIAILKNEIIDL